MRGCDDEEIVTVVGSEGVAAGRPTVCGWIT